MVIDMLTGKGYSFPMHDTATSALLDVAEFNYLMREEHRYWVVFVQKRSGSKGYIRIQPTSFHMLKPYESEGFELTRIL